MKNLITLESKDDIHDFVSGLWRSEPFQRSYKSKGFIFRHVDAFAWLPRFFAEESNETLERAHFSTWWNVIMLRPFYDNDVVSDLYYLHEMTHAATMPYMNGIGRAAFEEKMQRNELEASVLSEISIYFEMPELREASFPHEIYADRFLNDEMRALWQCNREVAIETFRTMRRHVMLSKPEHEMDLTETWIRRFADQNSAYGVVWANRYNEVEARMTDLQRGTVLGERKSSALQFRRWLEEQAAQDFSDTIPFRQEAELFSPFYWANKDRYTKAMENK